MHVIDTVIVFAYMAGMIGVGLFFLSRQEGTDAYFVGDRQMGWGHIGLSVVATDVGGGFSIGLGGLGFAMGLSGSWLLFTGLVGAWVTAVVLVPRVKGLGDRLGWTTFPDFLAHSFGGRVRVVAALVSGIGYAGFVGSQILGGATLVEGAFGVERVQAVLLMAAVVILYTAFGGLQAVIFTDTVQWVVLLGGLILVALPAALAEAGGLAAVVDALPEGHLSLTNVSPMQVATWAVSIIPIWFVANTLYQRIYAARDTKSAQKAWYMAGLLEWPAMAFMGVALGAIARVLFPELSVADAELALPLVIRDVLPAGVVGIVLAVYFSAIMSTADSCLLASVGHIIGDFYVRYINPKATPKRRLSLSRWLTVLVGSASVGVALAAKNVLDAVLMAYSFMVSGLFVPTLAALFWRRATPVGALASMVTGGSVAVVLSIPLISNYFSGTLGDLDPAMVAIPISALVLVTASLLSSPKRMPPGNGEGGSHETTG